MGLGGAEKGNGGDGYDHNTLYVHIKFSKNKLDFETL